MNTFTKNDIDMALQQRHGNKIQNLITNSSVTICGLGGLGSNISIMLARAGIGNLHIIDHDNVELTNINRQAYDLNHVGMCKTDALTDVIKRINPYINIIADNTYITEENAMSLLANANIICEAFDIPSNKSMLAECARSLYPEIPYIAASGMAGYSDGNLIKTKKISKNFYICGDLTSEINDNLSLMAPRVTLCAAHQANLIINLIINNYNYIP